MAAYPALAAGELPTLVAAIGLAAGVVLTLALVIRWHALVPTALALLGAEYAAFLLLDDRVVDPWAPLVAGGVLLVSELAYPALERSAPPESFRLRVREAATAPALAVGAAGTGAVLLGVSGAGGEGDLLLEAVGIAAAAAALGVIAWLASGGAERT